MKRLTILLLAFISINCFDKPQSPMAPSWDVDLTIPISKKAYTMTEMANRDTNMLKVSSQGGQLSYSNSMTTNPTYVNDLITIEPISSNATSQLGTFSIADPTPVSLNVTVASPGMPPSAAGPFLIAPMMGRLDKFDFVSFKSGTTTLTLHNNLNAVVTVNQPIDLVDSLGAVVGSFVFSPSTIPAYGSRSSSLDLAGRSITQKFFLQNISLSKSASSDSLWVTNPIQATVQATGLVASSAIVKEIKPQTLAETTSRLTFSDSTKVQQAWLRSGTFFVHFASNVNLDTRINYRIRQILRNGQPVSGTVTVPARSSADVRLDLSQDVIQAVGERFLSAFEIISAVDFYQGSTSGPVLISEHDGYTVSGTSTQIVADSAVGAVKPTVVNVDKNVKLDLKDFSKKFRGQLNIPQADMKFTSQTAMTFPMRMNLRVETRDASGNPVTLMMPPTSGQPFDRSQVGQFLSQLSTNIPDSVRVVGNVTVNPDYDTTNISSVGRNSSFAGKLEITVPFNLAISNGAFVDTLTFGDTTGTGKSKANFDKGNTDNVNSGTVHIEIDNGLPMQIGVRVTLTDINHQNLLILPQNGNEIVVAAAPVDGIGHVISHAATSAVIQLQEYEVRQFKPAEYVNYHVSVVTPAGIISITNSDDVKVRVWSSLSYKVKP